MLKSAFEVNPAFAVPFVRTRHPEYGALNSQLKALFLEREREGAHIANPNPYTQRNEAVFESNFDLFKWTEPCVEQLRAFCFNNVMRTLGELNGYDLPMLQRIRMGADAWFHITRKGGFFGVHNHPMASWSGVYCVDAGRRDPSRPASGTLNFINPFVMNTMFIDAGTAQLRDPYTYSNRNYQLSAGELLLFPSWVLHQVLPFDDEGERITVAFNAWFHLNN